MTSNLAYDEQMDDFNEKRDKEICRMAAIFVINGYDRSSAIRKATEIFNLQQEAINDNTGVIETLDEAQPPQMPAGKERQVAAIAQELYEEHFE